jgi:hypothetical protein
MFSFENGSSGLDENALSFSRGDSLRGLGVDVMSGTRGEEAGLRQAGRHLWGARAYTRRGSQRMEANFTQRGAAGGLVGGEAQAASGRSGSATWGWQQRGLDLAVRFVRGLDRHESFGGPLAYSEREAQTTRVCAEARRADGGRELGARVEWADQGVKRLWAGGFVREARSVWGAVRSAQLLGPGRLELTLGAGRHGGAGGFEVAPGALFEARGPVLRVGLAVERVLTPVWADLAPGGEPFLQHAWVGTVRGERVVGRAWRIRGSLRGGRVYSRALADRLPLEELWLRRGLREEYGTYDFALGELGFDWEDEHIGGGVEGFGLMHRRTAPPVAVPGEARSDPDAGFRAWIGGRTTLFAGDLDVGVRLEAEGVGTRETQSDVPRQLPAFVTFEAAVWVTLADATVTLRARNLEDRERLQSWEDSATGLPAICGRRDLRLTFAWRLLN